MIGLDIEEIEVKDDYFRELCPEVFEPIQLLNSSSNMDYSYRPKVIDDELGLEVVEKETIESKYSIKLDKDNPFHRSLQKFFDRTGFLTPKQLNALN